MLDGAAFSDILKRQQKGLVTACLIEHLASVQQQRTPADFGKYRVNFESRHGNIVGNDLVQSMTQVNTIELAVAKSIDRSSDRLLGRNTERQTKGSAGRNDARISIEHQKWLTDGVDNCLRQHRRRFRIL